MLRYGVFSTFILLPISSTHAQYIIEVGTFSAATEGKTPPAGWEPLTFPKIPHHTDYELVKDGGGIVVKAVSKAAASGLTRKIAIDLKKTPILQWRWKVDNIIQIHLAS